MEMILYLSFSKGNPLSWNTCSIATSSCCRISSFSVQVDEQNVFIMIQYDSVVLNADVECVLKMVFRPGICNGVNVGKHSKFCH